jgi:hypothetical protein
MLKLFIGHTFASRVPQPLVYFVETLSAQSRNRDVEKI